MAERDALWDALRDSGSRNHAERLAKNPDRIKYAISQFENAKIEYYLKNPTTGHFHCRRKSDDKLIQFYAGTGKIQGFENQRGIHALLKILLSEKEGVTDEN